MMTLHQRKKIRQGPSIRPHTHSCHLPNLLAEWCSRELHALFSRSESFRYRGYVRRQKYGVRPKIKSPFFSCHFPKGSCMGLKPTISPKPIFHQVAHSLKNANAQYFVAISNALKNGFVQYNWQSMIAFRPISKMLHAYHYCEILQQSTKTASPMPFADEYII